MATDPHVERYYELPEQERESLRRRFSTLYAPYAHRTKGTKFLFSLSHERFPEALDLLIDQAQTLLNRYPYQTIFALGRTPIWIVFAARLLKMYQDPSCEGDEFRYVAFSGQQYDLEEGKYKRKRVHLPQSKADLYLRYLTRVGLDPPTVVAHHDRLNPVVIVEYVRSGRGLVSFLALLRFFARHAGLEQAYKDAVLIHLLVAEPSIVSMIGEKKLSPLLASNVRACCGFRLTRQATPRKLVAGEHFPRQEDEGSPRDFLAGLAVLSKYFPGSTPGLSYSPEEWSDEFPSGLGDNLTDQSKVIRFAIIDALARRGFLHGPHGT